MDSRERVSDETHRWMARTFAWAIESGLLTPRTPLVLPTDEFFKTPDGQDHDTVVGLVDDLMWILGVEDTIGVLALDALSVEFQRQHGLAGTAGTHEGDPEHTVIRYDPNLVDRPFALISTLSRQLMHHLLHSRAAEIPGSDVAEELNTDLLVIAMGLGLMEMLGAEEAGRPGYMHPASRAYALAMFMGVRELALDIAVDELSGRAATDLRDAGEALDQRWSEIMKLQVLLGRQA